MFRALKMKRAPHQFQLAQTEYRQVEGLIHRLDPRCTPEPTERDVRQETIARFFPRTFRQSRSQPSLKLQQRGWAIRFGCDESCPSSLREGDQFQRCKLRCREPASRSLDGFDFRFEVLCGRIADELKRHVYLIEAHGAVRGQVKCAECIKHCPSDLPRRVSRDEQAQIIPRPGHYR